MLDRIKVWVGIDIERFSREFKTRVSALIEINNMLQISESLNKKFTEYKEKYDLEQWADYGYEKTSPIRENDVVGMGLWQDAKSFAKLSTKLVLSVQNMLSLFIKDTPENQIALAGVAFSKKPRISGETLFIQIKEKWNNDKHSDDVEECYEQVLQYLAECIESWNKKHESRKKSNNKNSAANWLEEIAQAVRGTVEKETPETTEIVDTDIEADEADADDEETFETADFDADTDVAAEEPAETVDTDEEMIETTDTDAAAEEPAETVDIDAPVEEPAETADSATDTVDEERLEITDAAAEEPTDTDAAVEEPAETADTDAAAEAPVETAGTDADIDEAPAETVDADTDTDAAAEAPAETVDIDAPVEEPVETDDSAADTNTIDEETTESDTASAEQTSQIQDADSEQASSSANSSQNQTSPDSNKETNLNNKNTNKSQTGKSSPSRHPNKKKRRKKRR